MEITTKIVPKTEVGGNEVTLALNGRFGKKLGSGVEVSVVNANEVVKEIFDISGFSKILQVQ